ncbi:hypothetical protein BX285_6996 [Streptomyces sp. 1114.5]|uniref:DUF6232 family protein n=1 Tax=Streptomyces sp. 1114.5 TaxID=1938830 RepID=UPI000F157932|nr:DUF6232 family protein [Streptomyces sp. 1114.5]RKT09880.1 hypothetical protein BX285_6996 [Streptomyces sp. 1114.5]
MAGNTVNVSVSNRVLRVDNDSYPLRNITRTQLREIQPNRFKPVKSFLGGIVALLIIFLITTNISDSFGGWVLIIGFILLMIGLVKGLRAPVLHQLIIETSSSSDTAVVSSDGAQVHQLSGLINNAIENPQAEFQIEVKNVHIGDKITQYGAGSTGKIATERE